MSRHGFDSEAAVLGVDEGPMEAGLHQDARDILRSKSSEAAAELHLALGKRFLNGINLHVM